MPLPLLPAAAWLLAGSGATAAGTAGVSKFQPLRKAFGQTSKQQGEAEVYDREDGTIDRDLGEQLGDWLFQRDPEEIKKAALTKSSKEINKKLDPAYDSLTKKLKGLGLEGALKGLQDDETREQFQQRLIDAEDPIQKLQQLKSLKLRAGESGNLSGYNLRDTSSINAEIDRLTPLVSDIDLRNSQTYQDQEESLSLQREDARRREERDIRRYYSDREDQRADRQAERELRLLNANQDRELKRFELDQGNKSRKADLFKALFGLGSAFMI